MADQFDIYDQAIDQLDSAPEAAVDAAPVAEPEAATPPAMDPYDKAIYLLEANQKYETKQSILDNGKRDIDPVRQAEALRISKEQGIPVDAVYDDIERFRPKPTPDVDKIVSDAPAAGRMLADPAKGPALFPDYEKLTDVERALRKFSAEIAQPPEDNSTALGDVKAGIKGAQQIIPGLQAASGTLDLAAGEYGQAQADAWKTELDTIDAELARIEATPGFRSRPKSQEEADNRPILEKRFAELSARRGQLELGAGAGGTGAMTADAQRKIKEGAASLVEALPEIARLGNEAAAIPINPAAEKFLNPEGGGYADKFAYMWNALASDPTGVVRTAVLRSLPASSPQILATVVGSIGGPAGAASLSALVGGSTEMGASVAQYVTEELKAENIDINDRPAVEQWVLGNTDKMLDIVAKSAKRASVITAGGALSGGVTGKLAEGFVGSSFWSKVGSAFAGMGAEATIDSGAEALAGYVADGEVNLGDVGGELIGGLGQGLVTTTGQIGVESYKAKVAEQRAVKSRDLLTQIGEALNGTAASQHAPELLREFIADLKKEGAAPEQVTAPVEAIEALFQEVDPETQTQVYSEFLATVQEAKAAGTDVTIPTEVLADFSKLKGYKTFTDSVSYTFVGVDGSSVDVPSVNEAVKAREDIDRVLSEMDTETPAAVWRQSPVLTTIQDQLVKAGQSAEVAAPIAKLYEAFFTTQAQRAGVQPEDLLRRYGLEISSSEITAEQLGPQLDALRAGATPETAGLQGQLAAAGISQQALGSMSNEQVAQALSERTLAQEQFNTWFAGSKAVSTDGQPVVVYRGEHGATEDGDVQTKLASYSFGDKATASLYATQPNDTRDTPVASRVVPAYLSIKNPMVNDPGGDPFIDASRLVEAFGSEKARYFVEKFANYFENTNNWMEEINGGNEYADIKEFLDQHPDRIGELYAYSYPMFDDQEFVDAAKAAGYDGAIVGGVGENAGETEYRVFDKSQIKSVFNRGTFDPNNPNILYQKDEPFTAEEELDESMDDLDAELEDEGYTGARVDQVDALVADKDIPVITLQDLVGKKIFPTIADRTAAAALYRGIDGSQLNVAIPLLGGPYFPLRVTNWMANVVWANRGKGVTSQKAARLKEGANYMLVVMGDANMHQSNTTVSRAFFATLEAYARDGRIPREGLQALAKMVTDKAASMDPVVTLKGEKALAKAAERTEPLVYRDRVLSNEQGVNKKQAKMKADLEAFPGFADEKVLDDYLDGISFDARKEVLRIMGTKEALDLGVPPMEKILRATAEPSLAAHRWGDGVLLVELDQTNPQVDLGTQGTMQHPDFPLGIRGKVIGKLNTPINYETLWGDWLTNAEKEARAKNVAAGEPNKPVNVRRAFELSRPIVDVTQALVEKIGKLDPGNIEGHRQARLAADFALGNWRDPNTAVKDGGLSIQGFIDALAASEASATLTPPGIGYEGKGGKLYSEDQVEQRDAIYEVTETVYSATNKETGKRMSAGVEIRVVDGQPRAFKKGEDITEQVEISSTEKILKDAVAAKVDGRVKVFRDGQDVTDQVNTREVQTGDFTFVKGTNERLKPLAPDQLLARQVKNGDLEIKQLGDGQIYYALKKGSDYEWAGVPALPGDKTLTSVVNNELGAGGIAAPAVLIDAIANGATVLDCFAVRSSRFPGGFLPALYSAFGFEVVGREPFDPTQFSGNLADAEAFWTKYRWNKDDGYPDVVVMRWKGTDADRQGVLERYLRSGAAGVLPGGDQATLSADRGQLARDVEAATGAARAGSDAGRAPRDQGAGDATSVASRAQSIVRDLANLTDAEARNLGLTPEDRDRVAARLKEAEAPETGPSSSQDTTTLFQPFDGTGAPEASKAAQALADLKATGFVTDQHVMGILGEFPGYLQDVAKFMAEQRQKLVDGKMTLRDVAKAYFITVSSMGSGAKSAAMVEAKTGLKAPPQFIENGKLRPEEAAAAWLGTADGQAALNALERGEFNAELWAKGAAVRTAYGDDRHATMGSMKTAGKNQFSMQNLQGLVDELNAAKGKPAKVQAAVTKLKGIGTGKQGFIGHLLGMGNVPTIDAVEINTWIAGQGDIAQLKNKRADLARRIKESSSDKRVSAELLDRITKRFEGLRKKVGAGTVDPEVWQHIAHHWLWDRAKGIETTHGGLYEAMRYYQGGVAPANARGFITFNNARDKFRITLTGQANLSTFLHESGHFFLEVMQDLVERGAATDQQRQDLEALRQWMGLKPGDKLGVPQHEKFARGFEAYLMEGKAPSTELAGIFQKFKSWLVFVYRSLAGLNVKLTDEVRGVMDRLLASDQAIQEARAQVGWRGQPMSQEATGLTDVEYKAYTEAWIKANDAQSQDADARVMLEAARELKKVWRDEKIAMTQAAEAELAKTRGYRAWKLLENGEGLEDVRPGWSDIKIDAASIPSEWRRDAAGLTAAPTEGGLPLDDVAEILGFKSGEEMLSVIAGARAAQRAIPAKVRGQMEAKHGKMDANALALEASKAVHNKPTMDVLLTEFRAMATKARQNTPKNISRILAAQAEEKVAQLTQRQLEPAKWRRAELKAATEAGAAAARGDANAAFLAKRRQMVAAHMHKATLDAQDRIEKIRDYLATFQTDRRRAQLGKAGDLYLDGVDQILEAIELKDVSLKVLKKRPLLQEIVEKAIADDEPINIPPEVLGLGKKNYSQLTLGELEAVHDAVKNLWTLAKLKNELKTRQGKIAMDKAMDQIEQTAKDYLGTVRQPDNLNPTAIDSAINSMRWVRAKLVKMEFLFSWLDGKPSGGLAHQLIYQPIADARAAEYKLMKDLTHRILDPIREMPREQRLRWDTKRQFMGQTMKGANIIAVALNLGNEQNKAKLLQGYNWNEQQLMAELNQYMTRADWDMVQRIWDAIESVWPHIERVSKSATGLAPPRVVPTSVQTPFGEYSGGYYPIVYDPFRTQRMAEKQEANAAANGLFTNNFLRPTLANGFTKKRTGYVAPIYLSLDVLSQHLAETVHYVTHYEAVKQADKIRSHPKFQALVTETMGREFWKEIRPWLQDIANNVTQRRYPELGESFWRRLRIGTSVASMGFNIGTGIQQLFGITTSLDAIGPRYWATGVRKAWLSPNAASNWRFALKESQELEPLIRDFDREVKQVNDAYTTSIGKNAVAGIAQAAFWHIGHLQLVVNVATWHGAYEQAIAEGRAHAEAVTHADSVVRKTQSAGATKDLADVQRSGEATKLLTMFYSYFSVLYNRLEDIAKETNGIKDVPRAAMRVALLSVVPAMLNIAYKSGYAALTAGDDEEDEDAPGLLTRIGLESINQLIGAVPLLRNLISFGEFGGTNVPAFNKVQQMERAATALKDWALEGETPTRNEIRTTVNVISTLTQTPIYPIYKQLDDLFGEKISDALE